MLSHTTPLNQNASLVIWTAHAVELLRAGYAVQCHDGRAYYLNRGDDTYWYLHGGGPWVRHYTSGLMLTARLSGWNPLYCWNVVEKPQEAAHQFEQQRKNP